MKPYMIVIFLLCLLVHSVNAEDENQDWITHYYKDPSPDRFVAEVRRLSRTGIMSRRGARGPLTAFLSRILNANPDHIKQWVDALMELPEEDKNILLDATWYSDTKEGRQYLKDKGSSEHFKMDAPDILELDLTTPGTLDMLWGYFMATGQKEPIFRIVKALELGKFQGALERFKSSELKTEKEKKEAISEAIFRAAMWSLESNCKLHPRVLEYCEQIFMTDTLPRAQKLWLAVILSKIKPEKYSIKRK